MDKKHDTITLAVSLIFKAAIVAAKYSGRVRKRSLKRLAAMDMSDKDKEDLFLLHFRCRLNCLIPYAEEIRIHRDYSRSRGRLAEQNW